MGQSVLVFVSHSSEDKESMIEPLVSDLEDCYINVWLDKRKIIPGDNLRKSIFREGIDKADIALIFFSESSLKSSWVDREIKHVLREEQGKGNNFDLSKIISIFDSATTYQSISERYPELTDDLLHLMPVDYTAVQLGQLVSAIWSKYLSLQGGDVSTQRKFLEKDREIFKREQELIDARRQIEKLKNEQIGSKVEVEFEKLLASGVLAEFIAARSYVLTTPFLKYESIPVAENARACGFIEGHPKRSDLVVLTEKGREFFKWLLLNPSNNT
ncbi:MAG: toll/interleukin-1 receptor domain-containing protein [Gallionellaceae bacterium]